MAAKLETVKGLIRELAINIKNTMLSKDNIQEGRDIIIDQVEDGKIAISLDDTELMRTSKFASTENDGNVKVADEAISLKDVHFQHSLMYYGTDKNGIIGAYFLPMTFEALKSGMFQTTLLNVVADTPQYLPIICDLTDCKLIVQGYQFIPGEQNIVNTIKYFNNGNKDSFNYNKDTVQFGEDMSIKNNYVYTSTKVGELYESEEIDKTKFLEEMVVSLNG